MNAKPRNTPAASIRSAIASAIETAYPDPAPVRVTAATPAAVQQFHVLSDDALVTLRDAGSIFGGRSRASIYRDAKAGRLTIIKIGHSTRVRVGDLRRLIGAA